MYSRLTKLIKLTAAILLLGITSAHAAVVNDNNSNGSFATAQDVNGNFSTEAEPVGHVGHIPNADEGWEWVSIVEGPDQDRGEAWAYYSFSVSPGQSFIFDIDHSNNIDSFLDLYDMAENQIAWNDDHPNGIPEPPLPPDPGSTDNIDSFLEYTFAADYAFTGAVIRVSASVCPGPFPAPCIGGGRITDSGDYRLNISTVPVPAAVWLFGTALIGFVGMSRRTSVKS
ncbi:MAG: VPLPA-CTERM sorting domain-containing protein [Gammaproteobacteria bacterium]|nr:VPLPA-CTERM sorting domain-containing protein [Gammaproteobacteria bacterium]